MGTKYHFVTTPQYRDLLGSDLDAKAAYFSKRLDAYFEQYLLGQGVTPAEERAERFQQHKLYRKSFCRQEFGYNPRENTSNSQSKQAPNHGEHIGNSEHLPRLFANGTFTKHLSQLANGAFCVESQLYMIYTLAKDYLADPIEGEGVATDSLPEIHEMFVALVPESNDSIPENENVFGGWKDKKKKKRPARGKILALSKKTANPHEVIITEQIFVSHEQLPPPTNTPQIEEVTRPQSGPEVIPIVKNPKANGLSHKRAAVASVLSVICICALVSYQVVTRTFGSGGESPPYIPAVTSDNKPINIDSLNELLVAAANNAQAHPNNTAARYEYANLLDETRQYPAAIKEYEAVISLDSTHFGARNNLSRLHIIIGTPEHATNALEYLLNYTDMDNKAETYLRKNLAWAYLEQGLTKNAEKQLAILDNPNTSEQPGIRSAHQCLTALLRQTKGQPWGHIESQCLAAYNTVEQKYLEPSWAANLLELQP